MRTRSWISRQAVLLAVLSLTAGGAALAQRAPIRPLYDLSTAERDAGRSAAVRDARVPALVGKGALLTGTSSIVLDKDESAAVITGRSTRPPTRYLDVTVFNRETGRAAVARVRVDDGHVVGVQAIEASRVPIFNEEVQDAYDTVRRNDAARRAVPGLDSFRLRLPGDETAGPVAEVLPLRSSSPQDPCYADRCMDFIFRGENGYLPTRVQVDLSKHSVNVISRDRSNMGGMGQ